MYICSGAKFQSSNWSKFVEVKGRVKLEAFEKFLRELPVSRNRSLMVLKDFSILLAIAYLLIWFQVRIIVSYEVFLNMLISMGPSPWIRFIFKLARKIALFPLYALCTQTGSEFSLIKLQRYTT